MKKIQYILASLFIIPGVFVQAQTLETIPPSVVQDIVAEAGDGFITLSWSPASDEDGIITSYKMYHGTTSVQTVDDSYEAEVDMGNTLSYVLTGLAPGTSYYAAITAVDDEGNESENYSHEVSATTLGESASGPDGESPQVIEAVYFNTDVVRVLMSESVQGANDASSVSIVQKSTETYIDAVNVETIDNEIFIYFAPEIIQEGETYEVTINSIVTDLEGNPVASGITDTVAFIASSEYFESICTTPETCFSDGLRNTKAAELAVDYEVDYFGLLSQKHTGELFHIVDASGVTSLQLVLDTSAFGASDVNVGLGAQNVCTYNSVENVEAFLQDAFSGKVQAEKLFMALNKCDVYDENGLFKETTQMGEDGLALVKELVSLLAEVTNTDELNPFGEDELEGTSVDAPVYTSAPDTIAPLDVTAVKIDTVSQTNGSVTITWENALDLDNDITDQVLYIKKNSGTFDSGISLGKEVASYELSVESDSSYEVKIVTVDISGNESLGRSETFSTENLIKTGGSTNVIWALALVLGLGFVLSRRRG